MKSPIKTMSPSDLTTIPSEMKKEEDSTAVEYPLLNKRFFLTLIEKIILPKGKSLDAKDLVNEMSRN
jgi:hypothetical protein